MPEIRHYKVREIREVEVTANTVVDAARIAHAAFKTGQNADHGVKDPSDIQGVWGNTRSKIRTVETEIKETR